MNAKIFYHKKGVELFILDEHLSSAQFDYNLIGQKFCVVVTHFHLNNRCRNFFFKYENLWRTRFVTISQHLN
jgi:hypothetical protein